MKTQNNNFSETFNNTNLYTSIKDARNSLPKVQRWCEIVSQNPFSQKAKKAIEEIAYTMGFKSRKKSNRIQFETINYDALVEGIILSQNIKPSSYDLYFDSLSNSEQKIEQQNLFEKSIAIDERIVMYIEQSDENFDQTWSKPTSKLYNEICEVCFGSSDNLIEHYPIEMITKFQSIAFRLARRFETNYQIIFIY